MRVKDINPHIRFASQMPYKSERSKVFAPDCRLFYVMSGTAEIMIENKCYELYTGSLFYCASSKIYTIKAGEEFSIISLNFDLTNAHSDMCDALPPVDAKKIKKHITIEVADIDDSDFLSSYMFIDNGAEFFGRISNILEEFGAHKKYYREKCSTILRDILIDMHRNELIKSENSSAAVDFVISYIKDNFSRAIENKQLAAMTGYHEYYLNRLFIKYTGTSIHRYIIRMRMNEARRLMLSTTLSISQIAETVGFNNNTYFSSYFKKEFGFSPSVYREKFRNAI